MKSNEVNSWPGHKGGKFFDKLQWREVNVSGAI